MPDVTSSDVILEMVEKAVPFAFTRWGDGEWDCILSASSYKKNCDGHRYFKDLSDALLCSVARTDEHLFKGMQSKAMDMYGAVIEDVLRVLKIQGPWYNADVFHDMSAEGVMGLLFHWLDNRNVVWVGNTRDAEAVSSYFPKWHRIECVSEDAWLQRYSILSRCIMSASRKTTILFCAGFVSKVVISDLLPFVESLGLTLLDMGSVFDPYWGRCTRKYHKNVLEKLRCE